MCFGEWMGNEKKWCILGREVGLWYGLGVGRWDSVVGVLECFWGCGVVGLGVGGLGSWGVVECFLGLCF